MASLRDPGVRELLEQPNYGVVSTRAPDESIHSTIGGKASRPEEAGATWSEIGHDPQRVAVPPTMHEHSQVLAEDPGLAEALRGERLLAAMRDCVAETRVLERGPWQPLQVVDGFHAGIGFLVLEGLLVRRVGLADRFGAELLGEGDLLRPWQREDIGTTLPRSGAWRALEPCRLAVLDTSFALRAGRYPEVMSALFARLLRRSRMLAVNIAIVHHPRVDARLHMLFWELADRWGTVRRGGVRVPLRLTHAVLADLVAAQRQTVSKALGELAARGAVTWTGDAWLLQGDPPAELGEVAIAAEHA